MISLGLSPEREMARLGETEAVWAERFSPGRELPRFSERKVEAILRARVRVEATRSLRRDPKVGGGDEGTCKVTKKQPQRSPRTYLAPRTFWALQVEDVFVFHLLPSPNLVLLLPPWKARGHIWHQGHFGHYKWMMCAKVKIIHTIKRTKPPFVGVSTSTASIKFGAAAGDYRFIQRGNTGHLHPINPEIDRTYHRLVRQSRNLPFHSVPDSVSDSNSISNSIPVSVHSVQYTDFVHSVALSDSEHSKNYVHSENMAQPPTPPGPLSSSLEVLVVESSSGTSHT
ncbi:hypothetical protein Lal_00039308, partial [Lupinus albus]